MNKIVGVTFKVIGVVALFLSILLLSIPPILYYYYRRYIYVSVESVVSNPKTGMVLGAAVYQGGTPSAALRERLDTAISLYNDGKIDKILVSGSHDEDGYDEPKAMKAALVDSGIPANAVIEDNWGARTYDSCRRANTEFGITELLVISQGFHLPRALFLCRAQGMEAYGVYSVGPFSTYYARWYTLREVGAMYKAVWDVVTSKYRD